MEGKVLLIPNRVPKTKAPQLELFHRVPHSNSICICYNQSHWAGWYMPVPAFMCDTAAELLRVPEQPALHGETLPQKKLKGLKSPI